MRVIVILLTLFYGPISYAQQCLNSLNLDKLHTIGYVALNSNTEIEALSLSVSNTLLQPTGDSLAFLVETVDEGQNLIIEQLMPNASPKYLLSAPLKRYSEKHGGISTLDNISLAWPNNSPFPTVLLIQTSVPAKGERNFMPGPPLPFKFMYDKKSKCFELVSTE